MVNVFMSICVNCVFLSALWIVSVFMYLFMRKIWCTDRWGSSTPKENKKKMRSTFSDFPVSRDTRLQPLRTSTNTILTGRVVSACVEDDDGALRGVAQVLQHASEIQPLRPYTFYDFRVNSSAF